MKKKQVESRRRESLTLAIVELGSDAFIGMIELMPRSATDRVAELGYWIAPAYRGHGYASEAARAMCRIGFRTLRLHRIEAGALARNKASIRVLEKVGFRGEGLFRERLNIAGSWLDQVWFARIDKG